MAAHIFAQLGAIGWPRVLLLAVTGEAKRTETPAAAPLFPVGKTSGRGVMHDGTSSRPWRYRRAQHETEREGSWIRKSCNN